MMSSTLISVITMICLCLGIGVGWLLRHRLPEHHLKEESRETVQTAAGMIATLAALVIGLLVTSSKASLDAINTELTQAGAKSILLDRTLARYGDEAKPIRERLRFGVAHCLERLWPSETADGGRIASAERGAGLEDMQEMIRHLQPGDPVHESIRDQAMELCGDLLEDRWLLIEQAETPLPPVFVVILVFWLTVLFVALGLLAPPNRTAGLCLLICAVSMAGAMFLTLEMNHPLEGIIQASPEPLRRALDVIGR